MISNTTQQQLSDLRKIELLSQPSRVRIAHFGMRGNDIPGFARIVDVVVEFSGDHLSTVDGAPFGIAPGGGANGIAPSFPVGRRAVEGILVLGERGVLDRHGGIGHDGSQVVSLQPLVEIAGATQIVQCACFDSQCNRSMRGEPARAADYDGHDCMRKRKGRGLLWARAPFVSSSADRQTSAGAGSVTGGAATTGAGVSRRSSV